MTFIVQNLIDDCAVKLGDSGKNRIGQNQWLMHYNDATEQITFEYQTLELDSSHDLLGGEDRYLYPDDLVQMKSWRYSPTPADSTTYRWGREIFEDQFRSRTDFTLPQNDADFRYWARAGFFELTPRPVTTVLDGGLLTYWKLATPVTDPTVPFELPATMRRFTKELMLINAKQSLERYQGFEADLAAWNQRIGLVAHKIEDRSEDRRSRIRTRRYGGGVGLGRQN